MTIITQTKRNQTTMKMLYLRIPEWKQGTEALFNHNRGIEIHEEQNGRAFHATGPMIIIESDSDLIQRDALSASILGHRYYPVSGHANAYDVHTLADMDFDEYCQFVDGNPVISLWVIGEKPYFCPRAYIERLVPTAFYESLDTMCEKNEIDNIKAMIEKGHNERWFIDGLYDDTDKDEEELEDQLSFFDVLWSNDATTLDKVRTIALCM